MTSAYRVLPIDFHDASARLQWDRLVQNSREGFCFFHSAWIRGLNGPLGQPVRALGLYDRDRLAGGFVYTECGRWGLRGGRRPWATPYNHPFFAETFDPKRIPEALEALHSHLRARYGFYAVASSYLDSAAACLGDKADVIIHKSTILLDLQDLPALWTNFQSELRNRIRRSIKSGVRIGLARDYHEFYDLYRGLFSTLGRRVSFSEDQFSRFCQFLIDHGVGQVYEARDAQGRLHVATLITHDRRAAYYTLSASHPELRKSGANAHLLWEAFEAIAGKVARFDMVGANLPNITRFKKRFHGEQVHYDEFSHYASAWARLGRALVSRLRGSPR